ncbi:MAG: serpin family protein [Oscillatoria princeps RMCB-10]|jgi:serpin B|nr:serpin family protein [Oscillatoria princeps RMCB-10]
MKNRRQKKRIALAAGLAAFLGISVWFAITAVKPAIDTWQCTGQVKLSSISEKPVDPKLIAANTRFSFKLFSQILKENSGKNVFVSPPGVALALSILYNAAGGETQQAMAKVLELEITEPNALNQANAIWEAGLVRTEPEIAISLANSLWANERLLLKEEFIQKAQDFYSAKVTVVDFAGPKTKPALDGWVSHCTRGKISQVTDTIKPDTVLFLVSAVSFQGMWADSFNKLETAERFFTLLDGRKKQHPVISREGWYSYYENEKFQAVSLPYGDRRFSLHVFLPKPASSLVELYKNLTLENWQRWITAFSVQQGQIQLPHLKLESDTDLNKTLTDLGMGVAFNRGADFSGIAPQVFLDQIKQKTFVEIGEKGTKAPAVTRATAKAASKNAPPPKIFQMIADRPFFCAIIDNRTGSIVLMGSVVEPQ